MNNRGFPEFSDFNKQVSKFVKAVGGGAKKPNMGPVVAGSALAIGLGVIGIGMFIYILEK